MERRKENWRDYPLENKKELPLQIIKRAHVFFFFVEN